MHGKCTCTHTKINLVIALCQASAIRLVNKSMRVTYYLSKLGSQESKLDSTASRTIITAPTY